MALDEGPAGSISRLVDDHASARLLAIGLSELPGVVSPGGCAQEEGFLLDPSRVLTNFVLYRVEGGDARRSAYLEHLQAKGIALMAYDHGQVRAVTHRGIDATHVREVINASAEALAATAGLTAR